MLCPECGCSEPLRGYKAGKKHLRLRPFAGVMECSYDRLGRKPSRMDTNFKVFV
jgi:hypothetical protein